MKISVDFGHSHVKATDGSKVIRFPSLISQDVKELDMIGLKRHNDIEQMRVKYNNQEYFIGELARKQSDQVVQNINDDDVDSFETEILVNTAAGFLYDKFKKDNNKVKLLISLPISHFIDYKDIIKKRFEGNRVEIGFYNYDASRYETKVFYIEKVEVRPQGFLALMNEVLNKKGKIAEEKQNLASQFNLVADVGHYSTDIYLMDSLEPISKIPAKPIRGMVQVYQQVAREINRRFGLRKELHNLQENIEEGKIKVKGKEFDISSILNPCYDKAANNIYIGIINLVDEIKEIDNILLTGGGAVALYPKLKNKFNEEGFENLELLDKPQFSNAMGGYKWIKRKL
ncbi:ParM/StbA family protein [Natroniella acetigena]|uniref:ParM/StbA family protein n=1 Tax=Natroniella acetigena TaxID=52004 RepID=UPI00200B500A|nr:ParM/StbA family protein [Natroniella acetigena]MCK8828144.1 ParM/StbA family protein [Natroniella acetigena]